MIYPNRLAFDSSIANYAISGLITINPACAVHSHVIRYMLDILWSMTGQPVLSCTPYMIQPWYPGNVDRSMGSAKVSLNHLIEYWAPRSSAAFLRTWPCRRSRLNVNSNLEACLLGRVLRDKALCSGRSNHVRGSWVCSSRILKTIRTGSLPSDEIATDHMSD
jgi:hypothetical protein